MTKTETWVTLGVSIAFTLMVALAIFEEFSIGRLGVVLFFVFWVPMLVLHELGHAVMARALGWKVREIVIGFGRTLWQWRLGETHIKVKLAPIEGYVLPAPIERGNLRLKSALIYAAGPGAELLLLALILVVFGTDSVFGTATDLLQVSLQMLAAVIVIGAGFNLLPFSTGGGVSDGLGIISAPFMTEDAVELRLLAFEIGEAKSSISAGATKQGLAKATLLLEKQPGNEHLQRLYCEALSADGQDDVAREYVVQKLAESSMSDSDRIEWLALQARIELYAARPENLTLDLALQKALALSPDEPQLLALKGASLVRRNRFEDGGNLLAGAWRRNDGSAGDAEMLAWLAIAATRAGNVAAAARFRQAFEAVNRSSLLAKRVRRHFDAPK